MARTNKKPQKPAAESHVTMMLAGLTPSSSSDSPTELVVSGGTVQPATLKSKSWPTFDVDPWIWTLTSDGTKVKSLAQVGGPQWLAGNITASTIGLTTVMDVPETRWLVA
jgi:hypothetical protein